MKFNKFIILFLVTILSNNSFAGPKVGGGGVGFIGEGIAGKVGTGGISFVDPGVGGGGVSIKVGGEGASDSYNDGTTFVISNVMLNKLKKLGVEKLLLENGETVDLSGDVNAY